MKTKSDIQKELLNIWIGAQEKGTIVAATGVGKTRIGVLAAKYVWELNREAKILIVVPTTQLRDEGWKNEFITWGCEDVWQNVSIHCTKTAHKFPQKYPYAEFDLVILDEIHLMLSEQYMKVFKIKTKRLLGLTATPPPPEKELNKYCPILHTISLAKASAQKLVSDFEVFNIPVELPIPDRNELRKVDSTFEWCKGMLLRWAAEKGLENKSVLDIAESVFEARDSNMSGVASKLFKSVQLRKKILYTNENKIDMAVKIIDRWRNNKWITFDRHIENVKKLHKKLSDRGIKAVIYHSGMSPNERAEALEMAKGNDVRVICTAEALNAGYDLPEIDAAIALSYASSSIASVQTLGRTLRRKEGKKAAFFNLYAKDTQEEKWLRGKLKVIEDIKISWPSQLNYVRYG